MKNLHDRKIRRRRGWLESLTKPEGMEATLITRGIISVWRWCDHQQSSGRFMGLDGEPRCGLCGRKCSERQARHD